ncbi:MAG: hypothetical protein AAF687_08575 [Pseudomonadota bacterium]
MKFTSRPRHIIAASLITLSLGACAGTYTGPVEVTRFVAEQPVGLGQGTIVLTFPEEITNEAVQNAFANAVSGELAQRGYTLVAGSAGDTQTASVRTSREPIASATSARSPVTVGGSAGTGTFGSGVGLGVGINLGGGRSGPNVITSLEVRISDASGQSLWEGRAQLPTSVNSPYSEVEASANALAAALFKDFPGGNGETVSIDVKDL